MNKAKWNWERIWEDPVKMFVGENNTGLSHGRVQWNDDFEHNIRGTVSMLVSWAVTSRWLTRRYQRFCWIYCLHLQEENISPPYEPQVLYPKVQPRLVVMQICCFAIKINSIRGLMHCAFMDMTKCYPSEKCLFAVVIVLKFFHRGKNWLLTTVLYVKNCYISLQACIQPGYTIADFKLSWRFVSDVEPAFGWWHSTEVDLSAFHKTLTCSVSNIAR
jgi:hypothetical protein